MENQEQIKEMVRQKYSEIALQDKGTNESSCCGSGCCTSEPYSIMAGDYKALEGYTPDADLGLGCGLPTQFAKIKSIYVLRLVDGKQVKLPFNYKEVVAGKKPEDNILLQSGDVIVVP